MTQRFIEEMAKEIEDGYKASGSIDPQALIDWIKKVAERLKEFPELG